MGYYIGLDLGSSAVKAVLLQNDGKIVDDRNLKIEFINPNDPGALEIDSTYYYNAIFQIIRDLSSQVDKIDSISWVTAGGSLILFDKYQNQLTQIISWMDTRSVGATDKLNFYGITKEQYYKIVGWPFSPHFPMSKLMWIKEEFPEIFSRINKICMTNDLLGLKLTNSWLIDESTATTMNFYDQKQRKICNYFINSLGLDSRIFPRLSPVGASYDNISRTGIELTSLHENTKIILGSFDHPGAARAVGLHKKNQLMLSCGTSWVVCQILPDRKYGLENGFLIDTYTSSEKSGSWFGMLSVSRVGMFFNEWAEKLICSIFGSDKIHDVFKEIENLAKNCDPTDILPIIDIQSESPTLEYLSSLLSTFSGNFIAYSLLEGVVFSVKRRLIEYGTDLAIIDEVYLTGGPAESKIWPQIIADVMQKEIHITYGKYAGAVGAARIAANGIGLDFESALDKRVYKPNMRNRQAVEVRFSNFMKK